MRAILGVALALVLACGSAADEKRPEKEPEKEPEKFPGFPFPFPEKEPEKRKKKDDDKKEETIDQRKLPGKWELTRPVVIAKVTAEFLADENMSLTSTFAGADEVVTGSYKFVGANKLIQALRGPEGEDRKTYTVTKLTDDALEYELDGVPYAFKRVKKDKDKDKK